LAVACDAEGRTYVADGAESNVKVFNKDGKWVHTIGEKGGHAPGKWNPQQMNSPVAVAVEERADGKRHVWVAENSFSPKRTSVWDGESGKFVRDYIGSTRYSAAGGAMSDDLPDLGICDGVFYKVDFANYSYAPTDVLGPMPARAPPSACNGPTRKPTSSTTCRRKRSFRRCVGVTGRYSNANGSRACRY